MASGSAKLMLAGYLLIVCVHLTIAAARLTQEEELFATAGKPLEPKSTKRLLEQLEDKVSWPRRQLVRLLIEAGEASPDECGASGFKSIKSLSAFSEARGYLHLVAYLRHFEAAKIKVCAASVGANLAHLVERELSAEDKEKLAAFKRRVLANLGANLDESAPAELSKALAATLRSAAEEKLGARAKEPLDGQQEEELDEFFEQLIGGACKRVRQTLKPAADVYNALSRPLFEAHADELAKEWIFNENLCHEMLHGPYDPSTKKRPGCQHR